MSGKLFHSVSRLLVLLAIVISANLALADACTNTVGPFPLKKFLGGGASYTANLEEAKSPQCVLITITDISWISPINITFFETKADYDQGTNDTDRAVMKNDAMGQATICFSSDPDTTDCSLGANPGLSVKVLEDPETGATAQLAVQKGKGYNGAAKWDSFKLQFFSDGNEEEPLISDFVTLSNPEPSTLLLVGGGVVAVLSAWRKRAKAKM
jgi:hypothetical protein